MGGAGVGEGGEKCFDCVAVWKAQDDLEEIDASDLDSVYGLLRAKALGLETKRQIPQN